MEEHGQPATMTAITEDAAKEALRPPPYSEASAFLGSGEAGTPIALVTYEPSPSPKPAVFRLCYGLSVTVGTKYVAFTRRCTVILRLSPDDDLARKTRQPTWAEDPVETMRRAHDVMYNTLRWHLSFVLGNTLVPTSILLQRVLLKELRHRLRLQTIPIFVLSVHVPRVVVVEHQERTEMQVMLGKGLNLQSDARVFPVVLHKGDLDMGIGKAELDRQHAEETKLHGPQFDRLLQEDRARDAADDSDED